MILPTIYATDLAFSGFGRGEKPHAIGYLRSRIPGRVNVPIACFLQQSEEGAELCVYIGLDESEMDSSDYNPFRHYTIVPSDSSPDDDLLQLFGLLNSVNVLVQGDYSVSHIDRQLIKFYGAVRCV